MNMWVIRVKINGRWQDLGRFDRLDKADEAFRAYAKTPAYRGRPLWLTAVR